LADQLNVSVSTVRNNMGWYKGMNITDDQGKNSVIYLKEKGVPTLLPWATSFKERPFYNLNNKVCLT